jgi:hypothetical protein
MAAVRTRKTVRSAAARAPARRTKSTPRSSLAAFPLRTAFVVVGVVGLAALGIALLGPRRIRDEFIRPMAEVTYAPVAAAVGPQADRAWAETRAWRDRVGRILDSINTSEVREMVASRLAQWIERFR